MGRKIVSRHSFDDSIEANVYLEELLAELRKEHTNEAVKKNCFFAFWSTKEKVFCDACDEDLQVYHGIIVMRDGKPATLDNY